MIRVIKYGAKWCGPCRALAPVFDQIEKRYAGAADVVFESIDIDQSDIPITTVPTFQVLDGERIVETHPGAMSAYELVRWVDTAIAEARS